MAALAFPCLYQRLADGRGGSRERREKPRIRRVQAYRKDIETVVGEAEIHEEESHCGENSGKNPLFCQRCHHFHHALYALCVQKKQGIPAELHSRVRPGRGGSGVDEESFSLALTFFQADPWNSYRSHCFSNFWHLLDVQGYSMPLDGLCALKQPTLQE